MPRKRAPTPPRAAPPPADQWGSYAVLPLRLFLGLTFVYAAVQKISDPGFLQPGSSTYIGAQLQGFAAHSPIGWAIDIFALPTPQLTGVLVIATEFVVGVLVLIGLATRWAAVVGALINFVFFLTASWMVQPYFLGSDSIYVVAWITLALTGDQGILTVRPFIFGPATTHPRRRAAADLDRRRLLFMLGGAAVGAVWVLGVLPRIKAVPTAAQVQPGATPTPATSATPVPSPTGTRIGALADLRSRGSLNFMDPASGDPAVAVSLPGGSVVAFDAVCTHAGCTVAYDSSTQLITCPCHGAQFDPSRGASVVAGPAPTPLASIPLQIGADGGVYAS